MMQSDEGEHIPQEGDSPDAIPAGYLQSGSGYLKARIVYDTDGIAPTLTAAHMGIALPKIDVTDKGDDVDG